MEALPGRRRLRTASEARVEAASRDQGKPVAAWWLRTYQMTCSTPPYQRENSPLPPL